MYTTAIIKFQNSLYQDLNAFSQQHPKTGRLAFAAVTLVDTALLDPLDPLVNIFANIWNIFSNVIGSFLYYNDPKMNNIPKKIQKLDAGA